MSKHWLIPIVSSAMIVLSGLACGSSSTTTTKTPVSNATTAFPESHPSLFPTAITPQPTQTLDATPPSQPVIANAYNITQLSTNSGIGLQGSLAISPGRVWVGSDGLGTPNGEMTSDTNWSTEPGIEEWDADTGKFLRTITFPQARHIADIKYADQHLWVLAAKTSPLTEPYCVDTLYVLSLPDGQIVKELNTRTPGLDDDCNTDGSFNSDRMAVSPGKIWAADKVFDTQSLQALEPGLSKYMSDAYFGYDGQHWMWINRSCAGCNPDLLLFDTKDPTKLKDENGSGEAETKSYADSAIALANGKMWIGVRTVADAIAKKERTYLEAYDLNQTDHPILSVDITKELTGGGGNFLSLMTADNHVLWLANNFNPANTLYYHDEKNGQLLGSLRLDTLGIANIAFDGKNIWVLDSNQLVRVALPWVP